MTQEALKLALEALKTIDEAMPFPVAKLAQAAIKEALAQPEQEPVATDWERIARVQNAKLMAMCDEAGGFEKLCEVMDKYEQTTPPQRTWVGLTDEEIDDIYWQHTNHSGNYDVPIWPYERAIEAKLKEKNI